MRVPRLQGIRTAALAIAAFFAAIGIAQYGVVRYETEKALATSLREVAEEVTKDIAYDNGIDPAQYNKSSTSVDDYVALLNDGTVLSYATGNDPLPPELLPRVQLAPAAEKALDGPLELTTQYDAKSKSERWLLLGRRFDRGYAVVGLSEHDSVSEPLRLPMLQRNLAYYGSTFAEARAAPSRRFDYQISSVLVDDQGNLVSGAGRIPLKSDAVEVGREAAVSGVRQVGNGAYFVTYSPIFEKSGRTIGIAVLFADARYDWLALSNLQRFDALIGVACAITFVIAFFVFRTRHETEKQRIRDAFQNYFSPAVLNAILRDPQQLKLGGQRREVTVLFSDIRSFTTLSEKLPPQQLTRMLQQYFQEMAEAVGATNGVLDKYIGDSVMAFWGAPIEQEDQADRAVSTALDMMHRLVALERRWREAGLPAINIGIGINTGVATVGNFGSEKRFDYTVIGDAVNTSSRLESLNKEYGTRILISDSTKRQLSAGVPIRSLGDAPIRGKERPVPIFEIAVESDDLATERCSNEAMAAEST